MAQTQAERQTPGAHPDTTRTEKTAEQLAAGVSPTSNDASADAERAVSDEPTPAARDQRAAISGPSLEDRVAVLEADLAKLRAQLRHSL